MAKPAAQNLSKALGLVRGLLEDGQGQQRLVEILNCLCPLLHTFAPGRQQEKRQGNDQ